MNEQKKAAEHTAHKPAVDASWPGMAFVNLFRTEALKVADETEKAFERSLVEMKRAQVDSARLFETQLEVGAAMNRAMFDSVRRAWNV